VDVKIKVDQQGRVASVTTRGDDGVDVTSWRGLATPW
jgi:hypothetical protein